MPTRLGWNLLLLLGGIAFAAINTGNNLLYLLLGIGLATLALSWLAGGAALGQLRVEITPPEEAVAGEPTAFILTLRHAGRGGPSPLASFRARCDGLGPLAAELPPLRPGGSLVRFLPARLPRRGLHRLERATIETCEPFGLVRRRRRVPAAAEIVAYPAPAPIDAEPLAGDEGGEVASRRVGEGLELHQIRPYRFDDDSRHLDWRSTARLGEMMVKEFLEEGAERLTILFDPHAPVDDAPTRRRFETLVSQAAALVLRCGERRVPFRFVAPGREFRDVDPPGGHRPVLEYLGTVEPAVGAPAAFAPGIEHERGVVRLALAGGIAP